MITEPAIDTTSHVYVPADVSDCNPDHYTSTEIFVAGALSTLPPFDTQHPTTCLPYARQAIEALSHWSPDDSYAPGDDLLPVPDPKETQ